MIWTDEIDEAVWITGVVIGIIIIVILIIIIIVIVIVIVVGIVIVIVIVLVLVLVIVIVIVIVIIFIVIIIIISIIIILIIPCIFIIYSCCSHYCHYCCHGFSRCSLLIICSYLFSLSILYHLLPFVLPCSMQKYFRARECCRKGRPKALPRHANHQSCIGSPRPPESRHGEFGPQ